jgi:hypothetical protein
MKKIITLLVVCLFVSCSESENLTDTNINRSIENEKMLLSWPCPPGYRLEVVSVEQLHLFKKGGCSSGFGLCFAVSVTLTFDCVKAPLPDIGLSANGASQLDYDINNDKVTYAFSLDESTSIATISFHKDITQSPNHSALDFDYLEIENNHQVENFTLIPGTYTVKKVGDYFIYDVPFY